MDKIYYSYFREEDIVNIVNKIKETGDYSCTISDFDKNSELIISRVLLSFLTVANQKAHYQTLAFITNKLIYNASKAIKRDINDHSKAHYIKIVFKIDNNILNIDIENNTPLTVEDRESISKCISFANKFNDLNDIIKEHSDILKNSLSGLILIILMLKKIGLSSEALTITDDMTITTTKLSIDFNKIFESGSHEITEQIINEIQELPQFPDSLLRLQNELKDPEWNFDRLSDYILSDPTLKGCVPKA